MDALSRPIRMASDCFLASLRRPAAAYSPDLVTLV
jgi:hypothetical protein